MASPSKAHFKKELLRKLFHLPGLIFLYFGASHPKIAAAALSLLTVLYIVSWVLTRRGGRGLPFFNFFTRAFERNRSLDLGPVFLSLSLAINLLFFDFLPAAFGILQICLADGAASLAGMTLGKTRIVYSPKKTYAGSLAFFIVAFLVQLPLASPERSALLAGAGAILESLPFRTWDNLIVPIGVALLAQFLI